MEQLLALLVIFIITILATIIGSMTGGTGLITIPMLIFFGLTPQESIATNKLHGIGSIAGGLRQFIEAKKIRWEYVIPLMIISLVGVTVGTFILIKIDSALMAKILGIAMLLLIPTFYLGKDIGIKRAKTSKLMKFFGYVCFFFGQIYSAFIGAGQALFTFFFFTFFFGMKLIEANATSKISGLVSRIFLLFLFGAFGLIKWIPGLVVLIGGYIGAHIGVKIVLKKGDLWVKNLLAVVTVILAIKLIFF